MAAPAVAAATGYRNPPEAVSDRERSGRKQSPGGTVRRPEIKSLAAGRERMKRSIRDALLAVPVGGGVGVGLYWLAGQALLAGVAGLCWAVGVGLTLRVRRLYPDAAGDGTWSSARWTGLGSGVLVLAALVGVSPALPISAELRLALGALVLGAGLASAATGMLAVLESGSREGARQAQDAPARPHDD